MSNYPTYTSSGPPAPPSHYGGGGGGYGYNPYDVNQYQYGQPAYPSGYGYGFGYQNPPGYQCPAVQTLSTQFPMGNIPPPASPTPPSFYGFDYQANQVHSQNSFIMQQAAMLEEMKISVPKVVLKYDEQGQSDQEKVKVEVKEAPKTSDSGMMEMKPELRELMRQKYIDEMMRRYKLNGNLDITEGTIKPLRIYSENDEVVQFYRKEGGREDLAGKEWDAEADCEYLRKAMRGLGTDEAILNFVVTTRCNAQRQELKEKYISMYGRDLVEDIISETSGDYRDALLACFESPAYFDAWCIKEAIYGLGTDELALIEILMTRTNDQIKAIREVYGDVVSPKRKTKHTKLDDDIRGDTSGDFKKLLISASQGKRNELTRKQIDNAVEDILVEGQPTGLFQINYSKLCDRKKAQGDAERLYKAGEKRWGTDEETFNLIFSTRDPYQLRQTWDEYVKVNQTHILHATKAETSGDFRRGLEAIVKNIQNRPLYFAEQLRKSMKGLGTDDRTLIRIVVSRSEIDMVQIKQCFLELTHKTLWNWINDDTSFNYKKVLLALVGKN